MPQGITIEKNPELNDSNNYELLRSKGLEYIRQLGSKLWTDYNIHDPGITLLEALCYAITDLGYRTSLNIKDLIADAPGIETDNDRQAFFTAKNILTANPWTVDDFRKLLIDINGIKNGWLNCRTCACDNIFLYANCKESTLQYEPITAAEQVVIKGLYDVLVEFEDDDGIGNLNSGKIKYNFNFPFNEVFATASIEMRLASWYDIEEDKNFYKDIRNPLSIITNVETQFISGNKNDDKDIPQDLESTLDTALRRTMYATVKVTYGPDAANPAVTAELLFKDIPVKVWFNSNNERRALRLDDLKNAINDSTSGGIFPKYLEKIKKADEVIALTTQVLHSHRNLCEDYCSIKAIEVEDIAVCADIDVIPSADIEQVLAEAYYLIDQYFSPDIRFYSLQQMLAEGRMVDEIFEGPALNNGFIHADEFAGTDLKRSLFTSDIINLLMEITDSSGRKLIRSIKNLTLVRYDKDGNIVSPAENWQLTVSYNHQPRLYIDACKVLVYKNGLPFLPDRIELNDTLQVVKARNAQPKFKVDQNDLKVPVGIYYNLTEYSPVQYTLPQTYGVSFEGLPGAASPKRKAQAKQLKAYLLFFEQLLVNYLHQLSHLKDLFAVDNTVEHSYYSAMIEDNTIAGISGIYAGLQHDVLVKLGETESEFLDRRNRFLDHMLARFAESFNEYALMLYSYVDSKPLADSMLIRNKVLFLKDFPFLSANRARSYNYKDPVQVCSNDNIPGLKKRIMRLLGLSGFDGYFSWQKQFDGSNNLSGYKWQMLNDSNEVILTGSSTYPILAPAELDAKLEEIIVLVKENITEESRYVITAVDTHFELSLQDAAFIRVATAPGQFETQDAANTERASIRDFAQKAFREETIHIVEHVLLRPRTNAAGTFQLYEEKDIDGKSFERRWRLVNNTGRIYLSSSTRYVDADLVVAEQKAKAEILEVCKRLTIPERYEIKKEIKWVLNLLDETDEVIATRKQHFATEAAATAARDELIGFAKTFAIDYSLLGPGSLPGDVFSIGDPLLPVCLEKNCEFCGEEDPYSFRMTIVLSGEDGVANRGIEFRRFAEQTIRMEVPAHLGAKICWVSRLQLESFTQAYCAWLSELAKAEPDVLELHHKLTDLLVIFNELKNVYPPATLHDCIDGNDENRVFLGSTII